MQARHMCFKMQDFQCVTLSMACVLDINIMTQCILLLYWQQNPFHLTALGQLSALITNDKDRQHILDGQLEVVHRFIDDLD